QSRPIAAPHRRYNPVTLRPSRRLAGTNSSSSGGNRVNECRNCGSGELHDLGPIGKIEPFFLKRVFGLQIRVPRSPNALKQKIRELVVGSMSLLSRVTSPFAFVEMQLCEHCFFIQTKIPFRDEDIMHLYQDYRSP